MSLSAFSPETVSMQLGGSAITLRALTIDDVARLLNEFGPEARQIHELLSGDSVARGEFQQAASILLASGPEMAAMMIALAADEPDAIEQARRLPAPVSVLALAHIVKLSVAGHSFEALAASVRGFTAKINATAAGFMGKAGE